MTKKTAKRLMLEEVAQLQKEISHRRKAINIPSGKRVNFDYVAMVEINQLVDYIEVANEKLVEVARILESARAKEKP